MITDLPKSLFSVHQPYFTSLDFKLLKISHITILIYKITDNINNSNIEILLPDIVGYLESLEEGTQMQVTQSEIKITIKSLPIQMRNICRL